jgi:hypothetical protein
MKKVYLMMDDTREIDELRPFMLDYDEWEEEKKRYVIARTVEEAIKIINTHVVIYATLDYHMGFENGKLRPNGVDFCKWLCENHKWPPYINFHTASPINKGDMIEMFEDYIQNHPDSLPARARRGEIDPDFQKFD